jgi:hypothetical protein
LTLTVSDPVGQDVQTPPCFVQNEQVHARAGISDGSGRQPSAWNGARTIRPFVRCLPII